MAPFSLFAPVKKTSPRCDSTGLIACKHGSVLERLKAEKLKAERKDATLPCSSRASTAPTFFLILLCCLFFIRPQGTRLHVILPAGHPNAYPPFITSLRANPCVIAHLRARAPSSPLRGTSKSDAPSSRCRAPSCVLVGNPGGLMAPFSLFAPVKKTSPRCHSTGFIACKHAPTFPPDPFVLFCVF